MSLSYQDWIYLTDCRALWQEAPKSPEEQQQRDQLVKAVRDAVAQLTQEERAVIELYHFDGISSAAIARRMGKSSKSVLNVKRRALRRLRGLLAEFAEERFGIDRKRSGCCICRSRESERIEELIAAKKPEEPYSVLIRAIKVRFGVRIVSPQTIIGHTKYHRGGKQK